MKMSNQKSNTQKRIGESEHKHEHDFEYEYEDVNEREETQEDIRERLKDDWEEGYEDGDGSSSINVSPDCLRVATLNVGQNFATRWIEVCKFAVKNRLDIVALQEVGVIAGEAGHIRSRGYELVWASEPYAGVALMIHSSWFTLKRSSASLCDGRLCLCEFELGSKSLVVAAAYMPTGLDLCAPSDDDVERAQRVYDALENASKHAHMRVVMGRWLRTTQPWLRNRRTLHGSMRRGQCTT